MSNYNHLTNLPYDQIINYRSLFRKRSNDKEDYFSTLDSPTTKYFKILFYFENGDINKNTSDFKSTGLLAPTWLNPGIGEEDYYKFNSAWSYLKMNGEDERANLLEKFVNLLSNINSKSPWYFTEVTGLDVALERKQPMENNFIFEENRKSITINCLPDALDNRIGTLMDLYRSIVWSWQTKREIIPSNLRKFDMALYIFDEPTVPFIAKNYKSSYKYIEFHNCEFDYNSAKTPYTTLSNTEGTQSIYNITILFDDCYEIRWNDVVGRMIGDLIKIDTDPKAMLHEEVNVKLQHGDGTQTDTELTQLISKQIGGDSIYSENNYSSPTVDFKQLLGTIYGFDPYIGKLNNEKLEGYPDRYYGKGLLSGVLTEVVGAGVDWVSSKAKSAILGNLYSYSLTDIRDQLKGLASGKVWSTTRAVTSYIGHDEKQSEEPGNLFGDYNDHKKEKQNYIKGLGNIFKSNTLVNNI